MSTVRLRRLRADHERLSEYVRQHPRLRLIQAEGDPPERYQLEFQVKSLRMVNGELQPVQSHLVEIALPLAYPRTPPQCRMLSPVFHPNIAPHAICVGDHWGAGESLQSIVLRIGEMLAYQSYNVKSPLNGEAARWVEENKHRLPLDRVSMLVGEEEPAAGANGSGVDGAPGPGLRRAQPSGRPGSLGVGETAVDEGVESPASEVPAPVSIACPSCGVVYRVAAEMLGRKVRCKKCLKVFETVAG